MSRLARTIRIDLTVEVEQCAICSIELGKGSGKGSLLYVLKDCRCVSLSLLLSHKFTNHERLFAVFVYSFLVLYLFFLANMPTT
jgi:hypothetical protein